MSHATPSADPALAAFERGNAAYDRADWATAERAYQESLAHRPGYALARFNYGLLLLNTRRWAEAARELEAVVAADPAFAAARLNLGVALHLRKRFAAAEEQFRTAAELGYTGPELAMNWAVALTELGRFAEAATLLEPLTTRPDCRVAALNQLALVRSSQWRCDEAVEIHRTVQRLGAQTPEGRCNFGVALLTAGRWAEGWDALEARWHTNDPRPRVTAPFWAGEDLTGRTILLWGEQGLGDQIQFVRFVERLGEMGATVFLHCPESAAELFATQRGVARVVGRSVPEVDYQLPLLSLPRLLRVTPETVPARVPYLHAPDALRAFWRTQLPGPGTVRVGLVWRGGQGFHRNHWRCIDLKELAPLLGVPGATFVSLQKGLGLDELAEVGPTLGVHDLGPVYQAGTLADTAAVVAELDLVISVDTSVAHLTGALARPAWIAVSEPPADWRWERGVSTSRWYPTLRLFRQRAPGRWEPVVEELRRALVERVAARKGAAA
jgi:tetratricopeptide (TPR) repeat protein